MAIAQKGKLLHCSLRYDICLAWLSISYDSDWASFAIAVVQLMRAIVGLGGAADAR